jgi:hypothetical protein
MIIDCEKREICIRGWYSHFLMVLPAGRTVPAGRTTEEEWFGMHISIE